MKLRIGLAAICLNLPVCAHAQSVTGPYVGLGAGTSILVPEKFTYEELGVSGKTHYRPDYAGVGYIGFGFGDGFRIQLDGDYMRNTAHSTDIENDGAIYRTTGAERKYGGMVNVFYDIAVTRLPIYPYIGGGAGYQLGTYNRDLSTDFGGGNDLTTSGTQGSLAYDAIGGVAFPVPMVPGLSFTAEYRFMMLTHARGYLGSAEFPGIYDGPVSKVKVGQQSSHTILLGLRYQLFNPPPPAPTPTVAPLVPVAAPAPTPAKTYLVFFDWDKYSLSPRALDIISQAASDSKTAQTTTIDVSGYTDTSGSPHYNEGLSWRRARAVAAQLVADGVSQSEIETHGYGETHLLVPTGPGVREPQNRRVQIVLK